MDEPVFNTEPGHVCPLCNHPVLTGFYYLARDVPVLDVVQMPEGYSKPIATRWETRRFHPPCAQQYQPPPV